MLKLLVSIHYGPFLNILSNLFPSFSKMIPNFLCLFMRSVLGIGYRCSGIVFKCPTRIHFTKMEFSDSSACQAARFWNRHKSDLTRYDIENLHQNPTKNLYWKSIFKLEHWFHSGIQMGKWVIRGFYYPLFYNVSWLRY